jgi:hypothetical protein
MHPSRLPIGPSQSRPLIDASPGSAWSPGLRVCRAAPSRRRNIHTHARFRTERQSFLRCRDMRLAISRKQRSGHAAALRRQQQTGSNPVGRAIFPPVRNKTGHYGTDHSSNAGPFCPTTLIPRSSSQCFSIASSSSEHVSDRLRLRRGLHFSARIWLRRNREPNRQAASRNRSRGTRPGRSPKRTTPSPS